MESSIEKIAKRDLLFIAGDFNAKTGSGVTDYPENIGKHGKGIINSSGKQLLETCKLHNLILGNTIFEHKKCH